MHNTIRWDINLRQTKRQTTLNCIFPKIKIKQLKLDSLLAMETK